MPFIDYSNQFAIGKGGAQVFPNSPQIQLYGQLIAKRQAEKVADEKMLAEKLANLDTNGLREADKDQYYKMYNDWRTEEQKGYGLKGQDKFNSQANAQKLYSQLNGLVANSKAKTARDLEIGKTLLTNPYAVNDEGSVVYHKSLAAPTGSTEDIVDYTPYRGYDTSKALPIVKAIQKSVFDTAKPDQLPTLGKEYTAQGKTFTPTSTRYTTDNDYYARQIATAAMATKETEGLLRTTYPNLPWKDDHEGAVMQAAHLYAADNPVTVPDKIGTPIQKDKPPAPDRFYAHWDYQLRHPKAGAAGAAPTYRQDVINRFIDDPNGIKDELFDVINNSAPTNMAGGGFLGKIKMVEDHSGNVTITMPKVYGKPDPDKENERPVLRDARAFTYNPNKREDAARVLGTLLNTYSTEKVPQSALLTPGGKKKVPGGQGEQQFKNTPASTPKKGDEMKVQGGIAIFDGNKWKMK